jgi:hypothetical protein
MAKKKIEINKRLKIAMKNKFRDLCDEKLKPFEKLKDRWWAEEIEPKLSDEEITNLVGLMDAMEFTQAGFDKVFAIVTETVDGAFQRIKDRQNQANNKEEQKKDKSSWTKDDYATLAKALNKFPGGTQDRWKTISNYLGDRFTSKDVIEMSKTLAALGKNAVKNTEEKIIRSDGANVEGAKTEVEEVPWSDKEQKMLETALRTFPRSLPGKERWTKIAVSIPNKTPKDCLARFRYVANLLKKNAKPL